MRERVVDGGRSQRTAVRAFHGVGVFRCELVREVHAKLLIADALANSHPHPAALAVRGADSDTLARDAHRADLATPAP